MSGIGSQLSVIDSEDISTRFVTTGTKSSPVQPQEDGNMVYTGPHLEPSSGKQAPLLPLCHKQSKLQKKPFIDDLTTVTKVSLSNLVETERIIGPLNTMIAST